MYDGVVNLFCLHTSTYTWSMAAFYDGEEEEDFIKFCVEFNRVIDSLSFHFLFLLFSESMTSPAFSFKAIIFIVLTLQASCYFLLLGYSRRRPGNMYFSSTVVFVTEIVKLFVSLTVIFFQRKTPKDFLPFLTHSLLAKPLESIKLLVPSLLYIMQNNLIYIAMSHLDVVTFQVTHYFKMVLVYTIQYSTIQFLTCK